MNHTAKIFLAIVLILSFISVCYADSIDVTPYASELASGYSVNINLNGSTLTANARISGYDTCDKIGYSSFRIQENRNGSWVTVASSYNQYSYGMRSFYDTLTYSSASSGKQYRAVCSFYIKVGSSSDTFTITRYS